MLDAVYVGPVEEKSVVAIQPKPAFRPLFEIATTRKGSEVVLIKEPPQATNEPETTDSCSWWRRGRVERYREHSLALLVALAWAVGRPAQDLSKSARVSFTSSRNLHALGYLLPQARSRYR